LNHNIIKSYPELIQNTINIGSQIEPGAVF
jgi:hypothetical protein